MSAPIRISRFNGERDNHPRAETLTWEQLVEALRSPRRTPCTIATCPGRDCPHKLGPAWSPAIYESGKTRANSNVVGAELLGIDVDHVTDEILASLDRRLAPFKCLAHATHSDRGGDRCIRLLFALSRGVPGADLQRFRAAAIAALQLPADPSTVDESRIYFDPSRPSDADYLFGTHEGNALDVDAILAIAPPAVARQPAAPVGNRIPSGQRNSMLLSLAGTMRHRGLSESAIYAALAVENANRCDPPLDDPEVRSVAASAARYEPGPPSIAGIGDDLFGDGSFDLSRPPPRIECPPRASEIAAIPVPPLRHLPTGIPQLDAHLGGGLATRALHVVISRTGAGKSGFAIGIDLHNAPVTPNLYASTELDANECMLRMAAQRLGVAHKDLLAGLIPRERAVEALGELPLHILAQEHMRRGVAGLQLIEDAIARVADKYGHPPLVCVDYLQMLVDADPRSVRMGMSEIANALRAIAQRRDCSIIGVSSSARSFYKPPKDADDPISYLGAAKESGDIEFAAANVIYLDVDPEVVDGSHRARLVVAKARRGTTGFVGARFHGPSGRWEADALAVVAMTGEQRNAKVNAAQRITDDEKVLAFVTSEAARGATYSLRGMRELVDDVPDKRCRAAVGRLRRGEKLEERDLYHPKTSRLLKAQIVPKGWQP